MRQCQQQQQQQLQQRQQKQQQKQQHFNSNLGLGCKSAVMAEPKHSGVLPVSTAAKTDLLLPILVLASAAPTNWSTIK